MAKLAAKQDLIKVDLLVFANQLVFQTLNYNIRLEMGVQSSEETLELRGVSCRDFAWLLVHSLHCISLATRFVSGYLIQLTSDVKSLDDPSDSKERFCRFTRLVRNAFVRSRLDWS